MFLEKKKSIQNGWPEFKENYYNKQGEQYDKIIKIISQEKMENFMNYIR